MVLVVTEVTVPANTPSGAPMQSKVKLPKGVLTRIEYLFPSGQFCLTRVAVYYGLERISPHRYGDWLCGNGETIVDNLQYRLPEDPTELVIKAYNQDDTYDHTIYLRFEVQPEEAIVANVLKAFMRKLGLR